MTDTNLDRAAQMAGSNDWRNVQITASSTAIRSIRAHAAMLDELDAAKAELEAFKRVVSEAVKAFFAASGFDATKGLSRFILPKPDPLVEAWEAMLRDSKPGDDRLEVFRAAIEARGGKIVWGEE